MARLSKEELLARAEKPAQEAMQLHPYYRGKIETVPKCPVRSLKDFSIWYTPGVAAPCRDIAAHPERVYEHTNKANSVAVVSDGTRVLGLGDIGPEAGMPVMEGKALLFKYLGGVDAVPICLGTKKPKQIIQAVQWLQPSFGGINLEDIASPKCFGILDSLRATTNIPVWHDDQQGTATVLLAGLINALEIQGKRMDDIQIAMIGMGAANVANLRLLEASGVPLSHIVAADSLGILHPDREDIRERKEEYKDKWRLCLESNIQNRRGGIAEAMLGADVVIAFSKPGPDTIIQEWVRGMEQDPIVFVCANPIPEIWPWEAGEAGARIVGTGRGDFPNQLNNSLGFPGIFRGALDVRARTISEKMCLSAAHELAYCAREKGLSEDNIVPSMDEWEIFPRVATAVGMTAMEQGVAALSLSRDELNAKAEATIRRAREETACLMRDGYIPAPPSF